MKMYLIFITLSMQYVLVPQINGMSFDNLKSKLHTMISLFRAPQLTQQKIVPMKDIPPTPEYSLNLMWINKQRNEQQKTLAPDSINKNLVSKLVRWSMLNPKAKNINLWYDSAMTAPDAIENTKKEISDYYSPLTKFPAITLKDVRDLPKVKTHPEVFSDKVPVYFRADLLRPIAAYNVLTSIDKKEPAAFIYADLDIEPLPQHKLLDFVDLIHLRDYGLIMADAPCQIGGYENSFQIFGNKKKSLDAVQIALIKTQIDYASEQIKAQPQKMVGICIHPENVFAEYGHTFKYLYMLKGMGTYDSASKLFIPKEGMPYWPDAEPLLWIPTKQVPLPPIKQDYSDDI